MTDAPLADFERSIDEVAECLQDARDRRHPASLLIGAGCSKSAGIPLAAELVDEVRATYPAAHARARTPTYPNVMASLESGRRYDLVARHVERARLNWAHIMMAWLMRNGYVGRILTTNFDNLVLRANALFGVYPSVYDLAAGGDFESSLVRDPSVFFLHGQHGGFVQLHTPSEVERHRAKVGPVLADSSVKRPWIVVGYSGEHDPVFECLREMRKFTFGLHWVTYQDEAPSARVAAGLLGADKQASFVRARDADRFFIRLAQRLGIGAPSFIADPFSHELDLLSPIAPFPVDDLRTEADVMHQTRSLIERARTALGMGRGAGAPTAIDARAALLLDRFVAGDYDAIVAQMSGEAPAALPSQPVREIMAWAFVRKADEVSQAAGALSGGERAEALRRATALYEHAVSIQPRMHEAIARVAETLARQAEEAQGREAEALLAKGEANYLKTLTMDGSISSFDLLVDMACIAASRGELGRCLELLRHRSHMEPALTGERVLAEPLLQALRHEPSFEAFLATLPSEAAGTTPAPTARG